MMYKRWRAMACYKRRKTCIFGWRLVLDYSYTLVMKNLFRTLVYIWRTLASGRRLAWLVVQCSFNEYNKTFGACQKDGSVDMRVATECHRFKEGHLGKPPIVRQHMRENSSRNSPWEWKNAWAHCLHKAVPAQGSACKRQCLQKADAPCPDVFSLTFLQ